MAQINILDKHTAELIAAGEVVERPASVVKELCENSIDAGATSITVSIENGGIKKIEIQDNGCGIEPEYLKNAFIRHATSKICTEEDLNNIQTLGFRGEALASVASVARVTLLTKTQNNENAYKYCICGGEEISCTEAARGQGTTITVADLFYNTPARMKFLKKDSSEASFVSDTVSKLALSHPEISFKFIKDGKEQFFTPGDNQLLNAIAAVLSREFSKDLIFLQYSESDITVTGYITPPRAARASRTMQYFYINGRFVKTRTAMAALENAYRGILMGGRFPGCVINIQMPCDKVDVNVHPAKTEVRFARESDVFDAVYRGAKTVLFTPQSMQNNFTFKESAHKTALATPKDTNNTVVQNKSEKVDINSYNYALPKTEVKNFETEPVNAAMNQVKKYAADIIASANFGVYQTNNITDSNSNSSTEKSCDIYATEFIDKIENTKSSVEPCVETEYSVSTAKNQYQTSTQLSMQENKPKNNITNSNVTDSKLTYIGEIFKTYILAQCDDEFCFIDKHAAHERIIYEKIKQNYGNVASQQLLTPVTVLLSAEEKNAVLAQEDYLKNFGLEIDDFGSNTILVRAVPADITCGDVEGLLVELASKLLSNNKNLISEKTEWVLHSISCRAAIKAGDNSTQQELLFLAKQIIDGCVPAFCPHGRPVVLKLTKKELEKQFGRLG